MALALMRTRAARVLTPNGDSGLLFLSMSGREVLGRPFEYALDLLAPTESLDFSELLGQTMTVELELLDGSLREFSGFVAEFSLVGELGRFVRYRALLQPWLALLHYRKNSRIFQNQSVPDVIKSLFREHGFSDFVESLSGEYRTWEYLVQYRESDFNFVSRIMEQEGIYYFFRHSDGKHHLVLADSYSAHEGVPGYETLPYFPPQSSERRERDHIDSWRAGRQIRSGAFSAADYDFERPKAKLASSLRMPNEHAHAEYEVFDYPGEFRDTTEADTQVRLRLEEIQSEYEVARGAGNARGLSAGVLFTLADFPREDQNKEYLIVDAHYELRVADYESIGSGTEGPDFRCRFTAIDSRRPYRAPRSTKKPIVEGPQSAVVVGQRDQEIWTDEYGRVKVQFFWDREGQLDENSSCWVRVSQLWAGSGFGGIHIPRIGQEVIVDFLEGDPDRPVIIGRLYNADNMPPYALPQNQTQSGIKSRSTKDGNPDNFNEIRFEDKKGEEELFIHAEKTQTTKVKGSQSISVDGSRSISVGGDESTSVTGTRSTTVQKKETQTFNDARVMSVTSTEEVTIGGKHTGTYKAGRETTVETSEKATVNGKKETKVTGEYNVTADSQFKVNQGADELLIKDKVTVTSAGEIRLSNGGCQVELKDGKISLTADAEISLSCGGASITLKKDGSIEVMGSQKVALTGGQGSVELAQAGATVSGPKTSIAAAGVNEITGSVVKIN